MVDKDSNVSMYAETILPGATLVVTLRSSAAMVITRRLVVGRSAMKFTWKSVRPLVWGNECTFPKL